MPTLNLPIAGGRLTAYLMQPTRSFRKAEPPFSRIAYAAAHVVADPLADREPWQGVSFTRIAGRNFALVSSSRFYGVTG